MNFNLIQKRKLNSKYNIVYNITQISTVFILGLVIILIALTSSCKSSSNLPDKTTELSNTEASLDKNLDKNIETTFKADGIIESGEYYGYKDLDGFEVFWSNANEIAYVAIKAKTEGFVAIGLQPGKTMKDADMIFGFIKDGNVTIYDMFSTGNFGPHKPDVELGGTNDIIDFGGSESGGFTILEFSRKLVTGDNFDIDITLGINKIIWAIGSTDNTEIKHIKRGYGEIELK